MNEKLCGVIPIHKPAGVTSHDVVNSIRRLYSTKQAGHTGTLDPMASGLLIVMVGRAVKLSDYLMSEKKEYIAEMRLGILTDSGDITGKVISEGGRIPAEEEFAAVLPEFTGRIMQTPPMYSAIKIGGKKLVDLARKGEEVERIPREIEIFSLDYNRVSDSEYRIRTVCSKGTYIRTLCEDIGKRLGCGAAMSSLVRVSSGNVSLKDAKTTDEIAKMDAKERESILIPPEELFKNAPRVSLPEFFERLARNGQQIYQNKIGTDYEIGTLVLLYGSMGFFALGEVDLFGEDSAIKPVRQINID